MMLCVVSNSARDSQIDRSDTDKSTGPTYSYSDDPRRSKSSERGVDLLPDPGHGTTKSNGFTASADSDAGDVPVPLRVTKKRRSKQPSRGDAATASASDVSVGSADLAAPGMTSTLRQDPSTGGPQAYANLSYEADTPEGKRHRKQRPADGDKAEKKRRPPRETADPIRDPVMRNLAAQQQLRVHIKAQPGTAVHITPSATPPTRPGHDQAPAYHARHQAPPQAGRPFSSGAESETEI